ncbi:hypothetical protein BJ508DRAFT_49772 [Ascobolus immersus RN42]|uniref:Uncharacterized protein n=1 Tax=Ascobolus immersus RN42 TaxID=1160509 RepID=A0A3N4HHI1_ASCIM|nr:hypothetical protein BJ508DRAFT_49772 [Ascobolus immersus RN42]
MQPKQQRRTRRIHDDALTTGHEMGPSPQTSSNTNIIGCGDKECGDIVARSKSFEILRWVFYAGGREAEWVKYTVTVWRATTDHNYHCPIFRCSFYAWDKDAFLDHFYSACHDLKSVDQGYLKPEVEDIGVAPPYRSRHFAFGPNIVPLQTINPLTASKMRDLERVIFAQNHATRRLMSTKSRFVRLNNPLNNPSTPATQGNVSAPQRPNLKAVHVQSVSASRQNNQSNPIAPITSTTNAGTKRKLDFDSATTEELVAALKKEYKKRLFEETMEVLGDRTAVLTESSRRRKELKEWFEESMEMLREVDDDA